VAEPVRIGQLLAGVAGLAGPMAEARLVRLWPSLVGPAGRRAHAQHVEHGILHVAVEGSGWLHRLTAEHDALLARCRTVADIRAIRFHVASPAGGRPPGAAASPPGPTPAPPERAGEGGGPS
jgi:hypothetical protein